MTTRFALVGLPAAGKTTLIAALWASLRQTTGPPRKFVIPPEQMPKDTTYLDQLAERWLTCQALDKTEHRDHPVTLDLNLVPIDDAGEKIQIQVPDIAGEDYDQLLETGRFPKKHATILQQVNRIFLLVRSDDIALPRPLAPPIGPDVTVGVSKSKPFSPRLSSTQGRLVALLKQLTECCKWTERPVMTVVLTAWDKMEKDADPAKIFQAKLALLRQFLGNTGWNYDCIGISAQGGDYTEGKIRDKLIHHTDPINRIFVRSIDGNHSQDLSKLFDP